MPLFLDPSLVVEALSGLIPGTVAEVVEFTDAARSNPAKALPKWPRISVVAERTAPVASRGLSDSGSVEETMLLLIQVKTNAVTVADAQAADAMLAIREAVYTVLQGVPVAAGWKPSRYSGGQFVGVDADSVYTWGERYVMPRLC